MSKQRFYIGKKELEDDSLEDWIHDRIPDPPEGTMCEEDWHDEEGVEPGPAITYLYRIEGDHVCYTFVCDICVETANEDYLGKNEYPTTGDGYAVVPKHCA